jgi:hypothetical protein
MRDAILGFIETSLGNSPEATADLNQALTEIQHMLARTPTVAGESRAGQRRVVYAGPLTVAYDVNVATHAVIVSGVGYHPRKP